MKCINVQFLWFGTTWGWIKSHCFDAAVETDWFILTEELSLSSWMKNTLTPSQWSCSIDCDGSPTNHTHTLTSASVCWFLIRLCPPIIFRAHTHTHTEADWPSVTSEELCRCHNMTRRTCFLPQTHNIRAAPFEEINRLFSVKKLLFKMQFKKAPVCCSCL